MRKILLLLFIVGFFAQNALAKTQKVRIAIFDTLVWEKLATEKYEQNYKKGLDLAASELSTKGYSLEFKYFEYDKKPLAIIKEVKKVKAWDPHFIVGPRFSSLFLLLEKHFDNTLVISPLATANGVSKMPKNFWSVSPPNKDSVSALAIVANRYFPKKPVHPIIEVDCKYCVDFGRQFAAAAKEMAVPLTPSGSKYLGDTAEKVDISKLIPKKNENVIYLLPNRSFTSGTLMGRISNHLKRHDIVFLGADGWGDWSAGYTGKYKTIYKYQGFRVTPWSLDKNDEETIEFHKKYESKFSEKATGNISMISYKTILAVFDSLPNANAKVSSQLILGSFQKATKRNPNYGRPSSFGVYELDQNGEKFKGLVNVNKDAS